MHKRFGRKTVTFLKQFFSSQPDMVTVDFGYVTNPGWSYQWGFHQVEFSLVSILVEFHAFFLFLAAANVKKNDKLEDLG